ncbi:hypothetical protein IFM89_006355 [Coptis chinensis]|uniref:Uncharacterized protein n=1 Tax=Coptis chinensis TaxID=261450 RepID=A0A835HW28_9MAGN|nr:hypothetical protein IFM89_006355 [Coptis chinensis]
MVFDMQDSFSSVSEIAHGEIFGAELDSAIPTTKLQWVPGYNLLMAAGSHGAWVLEEIGWLLQEKINNLLRCGRVHPRCIVYRVSDMELVRVLPSAEDEEGKLRILQYDGSYGTNCAGPTFLEENMFEHFLNCKCLHKWFSRNLYRNVTHHHI